MERMACSLVILLFFIYLYVLNSKLQHEYKRPIEFELNRSKKNRELDITVVAIVEDINEAERQYGIALNSIRCYCQMHKYEFKLLEDVDYADICQQKQFMFRRHCIISHLLADTEWILFIDADIAVVNPNLLIEEFIDTDYDITFYDRFVNWEVAAGSYIVRNTRWASNFLRDFADYENYLPDSFHGTDNGALHAFLQERFYPQLAEEAKICYKIWKMSDGYESLFTYEACIRSVMGDIHQFGKARILKKGTGWVRDIWLTDSKWSPDRDFMLHGLKNINRVSFHRSFVVNSVFGQFNWRSPFLTKMNLDDCRSTHPKNWIYDKELIVSNSVIEEYLKEKYYEVEKKRWKVLSNVANYF